MRVKTGVMSKDDLEKNAAARNEYRFKSRLGIFKATSGIRPGEFTAIVGPSGNGKSSLCKTISAECAMAGKKCYHLLSEEIDSVYKSRISDSFTKICKPGTDEAYLKNLLFESMLDWKPEEETIEFLFSYLEDVINDHLPDMVIFDNFTTSFINSLSIHLQGVAIKNFRKLAAVYDIAIIGVFHTAKGTDIYKKLITGEDVRGNQSSTNGAGYVYILSTYFHVKPVRAILLMEKARNHPESNKTYWEMLYDQESGIYTRDTKIEYTEVAKILRDFQKTMSGKDEITQKKTIQYEEQRYR